MRNLQKGRLRAVTHTHTLRAVTHTHTHVTCSHTHTHTLRAVTHTHTHTLRAVTHTHIACSHTHTHVACSHTHCVQSHTHTHTHCVQSHTHTHTLRAVTHTHTLRAGGWMSLFPGGKDNVCDVFFLCCVPETQFVCCGWAARHIACIGHRRFVTLVAGPAPFPQFKKVGFHSTHFRLNPLQRPTPSLLPESGSVLTLPYNSQKLQ